MNDIISLTYRGQKHEGLSANALADAFASVPPGRHLVYFSGILMLARGLGRPESSEIAQAASLAWKYYENGTALLCQRPGRNGGHDYIIVKKRDRAQHHAGLAA